MKFKTPPFNHQAEAFERTKDLQAWALFWEMGCGKTWLAINTAAHLFEAGKIDGLLVIAPNGVQINWVSDEMPVHWPDELPYEAMVYQSSKAATKKHQALIESLLLAPGFAALMMSYDSFMTRAGREAAERFVKQRKVLLVMDESQRIKTPGAKRTRATVLFAKKAPYRRILTGTPITNKPFDVYAQVKALDENFWKQRGLASCEAFKTTFGVWEQRINGATGGRFNQVVAFRNLDRLAAMVAEISSRVTKDEVLDLPPKLYQKVYFELTDAQKHVYKELRDEFMTFLDSGETVTAALMVTRLLRLQQITCGYLPSDDCEHMMRFPQNPRLTALLELLEDLDGKALIWARFRRDVDVICETLGSQAVRYDGAVPEDQRLEAKQNFQHGDAKYFVGNPAAAGLGLTLHAASTSIFYSNSFDLEARLQAEDRAHRIGQTKNLLVIDLIAEGTVDAKLVRVLRAKSNMAAELLGDRIKEWL